MRWVSWGKMISGCVGKLWVRLGLFGLSLIRLGSKYRLWNVSYLSTSCIIVKCHSFRVLTKALFYSNSCRLFCRLAGHSTLVFLCSIDPIWSGRAYFLDKTCLKGSHCCRCCHRFCCRCCHRYFGLIFGW